MRVLLSHLISSHHFTIDRLSFHQQTEDLSLPPRYLGNSVISLGLWAAKTRKFGEKLKVVVGLFHHITSCRSLTQHVLQKPTMSSRYSTRSTDSRKRTALGDISNAGGAKKTGAKKASSDVRPTPPVAVSTTRSSFGGSKNIRASQPHVNIDAVDANDPQACSKYVNEIYAHFRNTEGKDHDVLAGVQLQQKNQNVTPFPNK